jgi:hypothetical protein
MTPEIRHLTSAPPPSAGPAPLRERGPRRGRGGRGFEQELAEHGERPAPPAPPPGAARPSQSHPPGEAGGSLDVVA